jgi:hypothetical protein
MENYQILKNSEEENALRVSNNNIKNMLDSSQIFVFGSNTKGIHGFGAAKIAHKKFGAELGVGEGPTGRCYAIPTKTSINGIFLSSLSIEEINRNIQKFIEYTKLEDMKDKKFLVTKIGCGYAGYLEEEIAPLFKEALNLENIYLPMEFIKVICDNKL